MYHGEYKRRCLNGAWDRGEVVVEILLSRDNNHKCTDRFLEVKCMEHNFLHSWVSEPLNLVEQDVRCDN
jgi:hypothetical protein